MARDAAGEDLSGFLVRHLDQLFDSFEGRLPPSGLHGRILREIERPLIEKVLAVTRGNQLKAAALLGVNRNTLRKKDSRAGNRGDARSALAGSPMTMSSGSEPTRMASLLTTSPLNDREPDSSVLVAQPHLARRLADRARHRRHGRRHSHLHRPFRLHAARRRSGLGSWPSLSRPDPAALARCDRRPPAGADHSGAATRLRRLAPACAAW